MKNIMMIVVMVMMSSGCVSSGGGYIKNGGGYPQNQGSVYGAAVNGAIGQAVNTSIIEVNTEVQYQVRRAITGAFGR